MHLFLPFVCAGLFLVVPLDCCGFLCFLSVCAFVWVSCQGALYVFYKNSASDVAAILDHHKGRFPDHQKKLESTNKDRPKWIVPLTIWHF